MTIAYIMKLLLLSVAISGFLKKITSNLRSTDRNLSEITGGALYRALRWACNYVRNYFELIKENSFCNTFPGIQRGVDKTEKFGSYACGAFMGLYAFIFFLIACIVPSLNFSAIAGALGFLFMIFSAGALAR